MVDDDDDDDGDVAFAGVPRCVDDGDGDVLRGDRDGSHQCGCDWGGFSSVNVCGGTSVSVGPRNDGDGGGGSCCGAGDDGAADPRGTDVSVTSLRASTQSVNVSGTVHAPAASVGAVFAACGGIGVGVGPRNDGDGGGGSCCGGGDDGAADPRGADGPGAVAPVCTGDDDEYGDGVWSAETDDEVEVGGSVTGDFRGQYKKCTEAVHVGPMVQPASSAACQA